MFKQIYGIMISTVSKNIAQKGMWYAKGGVAVIVLIERSGLSCGELQSRDRNEKDLGECSRKIKMAKLLSLE